MTSPMEELFRVALGLAEPWQVVKVTFSEEQQRLVYEWAGLDKER